MKGVPAARAEEFSPPAGCFLVVYDGDRPVACGGLKRLDDESGEVRRVYVAPSARGRGLGRRILRALEAHARDLGLERLRLDTGARQPEAIALFESEGFYRIEDYNGNPYADFWYEKALGL